AGSHFGEAKKVSRPRRDKVQRSIHHKYQTKHSKPHFQAATPRIGSLKKQNHFLPNKSPFSQPTPHNPPAQPANSL
ncbi:MAG: hypothetical protein Q4A85_11840, partial [Kingella sp. (in: b-proteobacteria)]|nr:hypothetical protein [Kingella sp. (in: b-proteobacteria)]